MATSAEGVNVVGYFRQRSGLGEIARLVARSLDEAGIPHEDIAVGSRRSTGSARFDTNLLCLNADELPKLMPWLTRPFLRDRRTIGFWWWEVDRFPPSSALAAHIVDEIWVGSRHVQEAVQAATGMDAGIFPVPIGPVDSDSGGPAVEVPAGRYTFLFSFNFSSAFERKNPLGLVAAFRRAFDEQDGAQLVLKAVNGRLWPGQREALEAAAAGRGDVVVLDKSVAPREYIRILAACDAYVSLHRAEGFGLTIAEAMALGKPAIATGYSGNLEFMTSENSHLVPYELVPIPPGTSPYPPGARWADPDLDAAAAAMRAVFDHQEDARTRAARARAELLERHSFARAGAFVAAELSKGRVERPHPTDPLTLAAVELAWGPDLDRARPWARRARRLLHPFLRPYVEHQREVGALIVDAIEARSTHRDHD